jgi:hypothetical protein
MYLAFSFVKDKYFIYQTSNDGSIEFKHVIKYFNNVVIKEATSHLITKFE